jgi:hypothetical protein
VALCSRSSAVSLRTVSRPSTNRAVHLRLPLDLHRGGEVALRRSGTAHGGLLLSRRPIVPARPPVVF